MEMSFLAKGLIIGFAVAAPVGPIGILCIRRTLEFGRFSGFVSGLGAALADTLYGVVAAFGLTLISDLLLAGQFWLRLFGGIFLIYLGIKTLLRKPKARDTNVSHLSLSKDFASTFFLTLTNPMTVLSYIAIFAAVGLSNVSNDYWDSSWLVFGVFLGSSFWWFILSEGVTFFRKSVSKNVMAWINRIAGLIIIAFGLATWVSLF